MSTRGLDLSICWRRIRLPIETGLANAVIASASREEFAGFVLLDTLPADQRLVDRVKAALSIIQRADPMRLRRIPAFMPHLGVTMADKDEYVAVVRTGFLSARLVASNGLATVASVIVGLGARARVSAHAGGWRADATAKRRLILVDAKEQLRFVSRLSENEFTAVGEYKAFLQTKIERV